MFQKEKKKKRFLLRETFYFTYFVRLLSPVKCCVWGHERFSLERPISPCAFRTSADYALSVQNFWAARRCKFGDRIFDYSLEAFHYFMVGWFSCKLYSVPSELLGSRKPTSLETRPGMLFMNRNWGSLNYQPDSCQYVDCPR